MPTHSLKISAAPFLKAVYGMVILTFSLIAFSCKKRGPGSSFFIER